MIALLKSENVTNKLALQKSDQEHGVVIREAKRNINESDALVDSLSKDFNRRIRTLGIKCIQLGQLKRGTTSVKLQPNTASIDNIENIEAYLLDLQKNNTDGDQEGLVAFVSFRSSHCLVPS